MNKLRKNKQTDSKDNTDDKMGVLDDSDFDEDDFDQEGVYSNQNGTLHAHRCKKLGCFILRDLDN